MVAQIPCPMSALFGDLNTGCNSLNLSKNSPSRAMACHVRPLQRICVLIFPKALTATAIEIKTPPVAPKTTFRAAVATHLFSIIS